MTGYICQRCPLAFEVGFSCYQDLTGGCVQVVCHHCGTIHKIEFPNGKRDTLYALAGPILATAEIQSEMHSSNYLAFAWDSWRLLGTLPTIRDLRRGTLIDRVGALELDSIACAHCQRVGGLGCRKNPRLADSPWAWFGDNCPVCNGPLECVYIDFS